MPASPRGRVAALALLLGLLFGLAVWHGTLEPTGEPFPTEAFAPDPDRYVGERVVTAGRVVETDPAVIEVQYGNDRRREFRVTGVDRALERGQLLRLVGTLTDPRTIEAGNHFTVPESGLWYAWVVSFLAGLWVLGRILGHWRFDRESLALVPRDRPLDPREALGIAGGRAGPERETRARTVNGGDRAGTSEGGDRAGTGDDADRAGTGDGDDPPGNGGERGA